MRKSDALSEALSTAGICFVVIVFLCLGSMVDAAGDVELDARAQPQRDAAYQRGLRDGCADRVDAIRNAYQAGLEEGAQREMFLRQRWLAEQEAAEAAQRAPLLVRAEGAR